MIKKHYGFFFVAFFFHDRLSEHILSFDWLIFVSICHCSVSTSTVYLIIMSVTSLIVLSFVTMLILPIFLPARSKVASATSAMKSVFWQEVQQKDEVTFLFLWNNAVLLIVVDVLLRIDYK